MIHLLTPNQPSQGSPWLVKPKFARKEGKVASQLWELKAKCKLSGTNFSLTHSPVNVWGCFILCNFIEVVTATYFYSYLLITYYIRKLHHLSVHFQVGYRYSWGCSFGIHDFAKSVMRIWVFLSSFVPTCSHSSLYEYFTKLELSFCNWNIQII